VGQEVTYEEGIVVSDISDAEEEEESDIDDMTEAELFRIVEEEEQLRLHQAVWASVQQARMAWRGCKAATPGLMRSKEE